MKGLTERQRIALNIIERTQRQKGYPPTIREIGREMGITSTNGVSDHLRALERKGAITWERNRARGCVPTSATLDCWGALLELADQADAVEVMPGGEVRVWLDGESTHHPSPIEAVQAMEAQG